MCIGSMLSLALFSLLLTFAYKVLLVKSKIHCHKCADTNDTTKHMISPFIVTHQKALIEMQTLHAGCSK